jgi:hypothetical protein
MQTATAQDIGPPRPCSAVSRMWVNDPPGDDSEHGDGQRVGDREQAAARAHEPSGPSRTARRAVPAQAQPRAVTAAPERGRPGER